MHLSPMLYGIDVKYKIKKDMQASLGKEWTKKLKEMKSIYPNREYKTKEAAEKAFKKAKLDPAIYEVHGYHYLVF